MKRILYAGIALLMMLGLTSCQVIMPWLTPTEEPDKLGSWGQVNQIIARPAGWKKIVKNSKFQLGDRKTIKDDIGEYDEMDYGTYPMIDGSTVCVPMALEFARQHLGLNDEDANAFVYFQTTDIAYEGLISKDSGYPGYIASTDTLMKDKTVDLILATEPSQDELAMAKRYNVELNMRPVCYDAFVFITHKDNPVDSLSIDQIQKIYSGQITNWKDVGGRDEEIVPYQREENSGSQTAMEKQVMQGKKMLGPNTVNIVAGMGQLVETVGEYKNNTSSIGYTFKYYIDTLYKSQNIKTLKVNGVDASEENIRSGDYPFTMSYYGVIRAEDKKKTGGKFLDWMLSDEGQQCIEQAGYCPL